MTALPFPSAPRYIPVASDATCTFRLEVPVLGKGQAPSEHQMHELEYTRQDQKWLMTVVQYSDNDYKLEVDSPMLRFTYKQYQRTNDADIEYKRPGAYLTKGRLVTSFFVGVEVTVVEGPSAAVLKSPWNFTSSEQMRNWDVVLCVGETKFYAHKHTLSLVSSTLQTTFKGDFREKNEQEVPVNVEGADARHFEAFLQCLYPYGTEPKAEFILELVTLADYFDTQPLLEKCLVMLKYLPNVPKLDKLLIAFKVNSTALEEEVVASLTKDDLQELLASDLKDQLGGVSWQKIASKCHAMSMMDKLRIALKVNSAALEEEVIASLTKDDLQELLASDLKDHLGDARWQKLMKRALAL